jgi:hypothetical protein
MIKELSVNFEVKECCEALRVSRSGFYRWQEAEPSRREKENAQLVEQIKKVFAANKSRYGSPRVTRELRQQGLQCGEKRIARLMRQNKLVARAKKASRPRTTVAGSSAVPNLIKGLEPTGVNQIWVSDITYLATLEGWLYLAVILDVFSRKVVGSRPFMPACDLDRSVAFCFYNKLEKPNTLVSVFRGKYSHRTRRPTAQACPLSQTKRSIPNCSSASTSNATVGSNGCTKNWPKSKALK